MDVTDDTFLRAPRAAVRRDTSADWTGWLPDLELAVAQDRGEEGVRWRASCRGADRCGGSAEVWLEDVPGGTVAHLYVRLDPSDPAAGEAGAATAADRTGRHARHLPDRVRRTWKRGLHAWKDSQEGDRST